MSVVAILLLLPTEIALHIFQFLNCKDLGRVIQVCRYWKLLSEDNSIWRELYRLCYFETDALRSRALSITNWKSVFQEKLYLERAWKKEFRSERKIAKYQSRVNCLQFDAQAERVAAGYDRQIKIWDMKEFNKALQTLVGHTEPICYLQYTDDMVVSCSVDRTIQVFALPSSSRTSPAEGYDKPTQSVGTDIGEIVKSQLTIEGHTEQVNRLQFDRQKIVSGSRDNTVKIWDFATGKCIRTLLGHEASVLCVKYDGDIIASSSGDKTIKLWDARIGGLSTSRNGNYSNTSSSTSSSACVRTLVGHEHWVYYFQMGAPQSHMIVSGARDATVRIWDTRSGARGPSMSPMSTSTSANQNASTISSSSNNNSTAPLSSGCVAVLRQHTDSVCTLQADSQKIVSGSVDMSILIWDAKDLTLTSRIEESHTGSVYCLQFEENLLISGGGDGHIRCFDFAPVAPATTNPVLTKKPTAAHSPSGTAAQPTRASGGGGWWASRPWRR